jgi:glycine/D-amino acid oxidase-like deaminating enzyme
MTEEPGNHTANCGCVLIGGGIIGASIAYHLRQDGFSGRLLVIERDTTYARAATPLSLGGIRQLYGVACNIQMALQGFVERSRELHCTWLQDEVVGFTPVSGQTFTVRTRSSGEISTPALVIVSGAWAQQVAGLAGITLPVHAL